MELRDVLIPAHVCEVKIEHDSHHVSEHGLYREIAGRRRIKMAIELEPRSNEELNWLTQSLAENGMRICLVPDGSPIMHPTIVSKKAIAPVDKPKTLDSSW